MSNYAFFGPNSCDNRDAYAMVLTLARSSISNSKSGLYSPFFGLIFTCPKRVQSTFPVATVSDLFGDPSHAFLTKELDGFSPGQCDRLGFSVFGSDFVLYCHIQMSPNFLFCLHSLRFYLPKF